jgi:hypothetical protein
VTHAAASLPEHAIDAELRADALDVVRDAMWWRLTQPRWQTVQLQVSVLAAALHKGDAAAFRSAVYELELAGPVRATGFGDPPVVEPPEPVREEMNELIGALAGD